MLVDVENLWQHYQRTMDEWRKTFDKTRAEIQKSDPDVFKETFRCRWPVYLEGTRELFGKSLDLSYIVITKGHRADHFPSWHSSPRVGANLIGGDQEPECFK